MMQHAWKKYGGIGNMKGASKLGVMSGLGGRGALYSSSPGFEHVDQK